ncbi:MAG: transketolase [Clostridia bacterium]|nr:transketolase [Clostridia bacterium]
MELEKLNQLKKTAAKIRLGIIESVHAAKSGHPGGSLSIADIITYLYFEEMNVDPKNPKWEDRDRFVLSKGHTAPALYATLAEKGFFPVDALKTLRKVDSFLQGHPDMKGTPGVDMSSGSLGLGFSSACGMALAAKIQGKDFRVYSIVGDGESEEGQIWEAAMFAAHYKLDNLCVVFDFNGLQIDGPVSEVMNPAPHDKKLEAFGFHVISIDGHDFEQIEAAFKEAREVKGKPCAIVATTVKGKGVSFMENQVNWHGAAPNDEQYEIAVAEISKSL